jgi:hypothetical protein
MTHEVDALAVDRVFSRTIFNTFIASISASSPLE